MDRRIEAVLFKIESESTQSRTIRALAESVGLSDSRLRHLFKQETGESLSQHIKTLRLKRSEVLLCTTYLSIKEIAHRIGLDSSSYFARQFQKHFGLTPKAYRARFGKAIKNKNRRKIDL